MRRTELRVSCGQTHQQLNGPPGPSGAVVTWGLPSLGPINVYADCLSGSPSGFLVISSADGGQSLSVASELCVVSTSLPPRSLGVGGPLPASSVQVCLSLWDKMVLHA